MTTIASTDAPPALPELQNAVLDDAALDALFTDIECAAELLGLTVKGGRERLAAEDTPSLARARALLRARSVLGVQLRYRFQGAEWWDTLMCLPQGGARLVRIRHERA